MNPYITTKEQIKELLFISDVSFDNKIDLMIPVITDDMTRTNGICNQDFLLEGICDIDGTAVLTNVNIRGALYVGAIVKVDDLTDAIVLSYTDDTITLDKAVSNTEEETSLIIRSFPLGAKTIISQMVMYKIKSSSVNSDYGKDVKSKSMGGVSVTYAGDGDTIDSRFGYPGSLLKALSTVRKKRFY